MAQSDIDRLEDLAVTLMLNEVGLSEAELPDRLLTLRAIYPTLTDADVDVVLGRLMSRLLVDMDLGTSIVGKQHVPWLPSRKTEYSWRHWNNYRRLLVKQRRPLKVVDRVSQHTDEVLDLAGDPATPGSWQRRGLVIGEVQSGKTSTYLGLMNKAADVGYRLFIVIGGHTENLRKQTQERVDEGFVGRDSAFLVQELRALRPQKRIGVAEFDPHTLAHAFTTVTSDFSTGVAQSNNFEVSETMSEPIVLVVKKNKRVLDNLYGWLEGQSVSGQLTLPLMLIDDEADYASINTRAAEDPTAINLAIRNLLGLSARSTYVAFTATPFANVLIDGENEQDLFPSDFIYALESPVNYVGADKVFSTEVPYTQLRVDVEDADTYFPFGHKSWLVVEELPESLRNALRLFVLANGIRDLRGQADEPRSMLVHVSRFNRVQQQVFELISEELGAIRNAIELEVGDQLPVPGNQVLAALEATFREEYLDCGFLWEEVVLSLPRAIQGLEVRLVNSKTSGSASYNELVARGSSRYVAVGGAVLSRGLTLDGLMISYFYQKSRASDTLLQMGRWFGFRDGYEDLTRIWVDEEVATWYDFISDASRQLREDLAAMHAIGLTPRDFGMKVAKHPGSLLVTAANKTRTAVLTERTISLRGQSFESHKLRAEDQQLRANAQAALVLSNELAESGSPEVASGKPVWRNVSKATVGRFLNGFRSHESDIMFDNSRLAQHIATTVGEDLSGWDVAFATGEGPALTIGSVEVSIVRRTLTPSDGAWLVTQRRRVASAGDLRTAMRANDRDRALQVAANRKVSASERFLTQFLSRPLLIVYAIQPEGVPDLNDLAEAVVAVKVAFPGYPDGLDAEHAEDDRGQRFLLNTIAQRTWLPEYQLTAGWSDDDWQDVDE